ncbi:hypothetical protein [uncultured Vagococcus sp.]|uniref:hypothetical protein n=1 Tax=uncultured Vagococcus sp. TaxID=189676 RepID=UPI0025848E6D|nr:hypothetical protein [uncultured Vagococcus sp.]
MKLKVISSQNLDTFEEEVNSFVELLEEYDSISEYSVTYQANPVAMTIGHSMLQTEYTAFIEYEGEFQMEGAYS